MKTIYTFLFALLFASGSFAQHDVYLKINHQLGAAAFQMNTPAMNNNNVEFNVSRLEYYISKVTLVHDGGMQTVVPNKWLLVNASTPVNELLGNFSITNLEGVKFGVGVEAAVNHSDPSTYASTHPLAPKSPSMHWGWSAGYRFVAMEGKAGSGLTQTYEIHALEDNNYFETTVMTTGSLNGQDIVIDLDADYAMALRNIDVSTGPITHGGFGEAITLLQNFRDHVFTPAGTVTALTDKITKSNMALAPNPATAGHNVTVQGDFPQGATLTVTDLAGRIVMESAAAAKVQLRIDAPGYYLVSAKLDGQLIATRKLLIGQ